MLIRFASFYSYLRTSLSYVFTSFSVSLSVTDVAQRESSHIKSRVYCGISTIRSSIVIWEINGRALNKHAVVAVVDRTWSYSQARICKWQRPSIRDRGDHSPQFFHRTPDSSRNPRQRSPFECNFYGNFTNKNLLPQFQFLNRLNKRFERTGNNDRFRE